MKSFLLIEYAQLLERSDNNQALEIYTKVKDFYVTEFDQTPPVEILNNMANVYVRKGEWKRAKELFYQALEQLDRSEADLRIEDPDYEGTQPGIEIQALRTTIKYNLARFMEKTYEQQQAIKLYKQIIKQVPQYIDAFLRLGIIFKNRGCFYEADEYFKEAIAVNKYCADAWALMGNLRFAKKEWGPGQKHFENILKRHPKDAYALLSLANLWIHMYYQSNKSVEKSERRLLASEQTFKDILSKYDERNIFAANGLGCIMALKKNYPQATEIFTIVREASGSGPNDEGMGIHKDVYLNLGHVFMDQQRFAQACPVYESAIRKFDLNDDTDVLLSYAKCLFKLNKFEECKDIVLKARHLAPGNQMILYNLGIVLKCHASRVVQSEKSTFYQIKTACNDLQLALGYFEYLSKFGEKTIFHFPNLATTEASFIRDLSLQADQTLARARAVEEASVKTRLEQQRAKAEARKKEDEAKKALEEAKQREVEERMKAREAQLEKMKSIISQIQETPEQFKQKEKEKKGKKKKDESSGSEDENGEKKPKQKKKRGKKKKADEEMDDFVDDEDAAFVSRGANNAKNGKKPNMQYKDSGKFKSKAMIDSDSDSSSDDEVAKKEADSDDSSSENKIVKKKTVGRHRFSKKTC